MSLQSDGSIRGGDNTTSLGGSLPRRSQRPGWKNSLSQWPCVRDQGEPLLWIVAVVSINSLERDGLHQAELCPRHTMKMNTKNTLILDWSQPGITMTAPTIRHRDVGDKYATGVPKIKKIRGRENIAVGTWNVRTMRPAGKLEQLTHAVSLEHSGALRDALEKLW